MAWVIDSNHTTLGFTARHMMITKVRGQFTEFSGTIQLDEDNLENSHFEGVAQAASIETGTPDRDTHLRSADFLDAATYPEIKLVSRSIEALGDGAYKLSADLTIKDVTQPVALTITDEGRGQDPWGNRRHAFSATGEINRKDWGLTWNVALETGGFLVSDKIQLDLELQVLEPVEQPA